jgi:hypothetical protein
MNIANVRMNGLNFVCGLGKVMPRLLGPPTPVFKGPGWGRGKPKAGYSFQIKANLVVVRNEAVSSPEHGRDKIGLVPVVRDGRACHDPQSAPTDAPLVAMVLQRSGKTRLSAT